MFPLSELQEKGAKRAVLEYIVSHDPTIPVPETIPLEHAGPGTILRSDHWREFDDFYGIFESVQLGSAYYPPTHLNMGTFTDKEQALAFMHFRETVEENADSALRY